MSSLMRIGIRVAIGTIALAMAPASAAPLFSDGFESYAIGALDKNLAGGPNAADNGTGNPWFGPNPPNAQVVGVDDGVTPHSGSHMVRGAFVAAADLDQNWYNLGYRLNNGSPFPGGVLLDWWFYDTLGAGGKNLQDYVALGYYDTAPSDTDYPGTRSLNANVVSVQRLSLGAGADQKPGFDAGVYQARVAGATDGYDHGWVNTPVARTIGWHHGRIVVGPALADGTNTVNFFIDQTSAPAVSHNSVSALGYNVIELNTKFGTQTGYFDDIRFDTITPGDASLNGDVGFEDLLILAQHYGDTNATWESGDFTGDGTVGFDDLLVLAQHYGQGIDSPSGGASPVPEPGAIAMITSLAAAAFLRRRPPRSRPFRSPHHL